MLNSQLFNILRTFSRKELKELEKLVASPYFSTGRNLIPFFKLLKKYYPEFDSDKINEQYIFNKLFPGKKFNGSIIKKFISDLTKNCMQFLTLQQMNKNEITKKITLTDSLIGKGLLNLADKLITENENKIKGMDYVEDRMWTQLMLYDNRSLYYNVSRDSRSFDKYIEHRENTANFYSKFIIHLSFLSYLFIKVQIHLKPKSFPDNKLLKLIEAIDLKALVSDKKFNANDQSELIYNLELLLLIASKDDDDIETFDKAMNLFFKNYNLIDKNFSGFIITILRGILKYKLSPADRFTIQQRRFHLQKFILKNNLHLNPISGNFEINEFMNFFRTAYDLNETEWLKKFVKNYLPFIKADNRQFIEGFCKSHLHFTDSEFESCLNSLSKINHTIYSDKSYIYYLKAACFFELNLINECNSVVETYSKYINGQIKNYLQETIRHKSFIKCMRLLIRYSEKRDENILYEISKESNNNYPFLNEFFKSKTSTIVKNI